MPPEDNPNNNDSDSAEQNLQEQEGKLPRNKEEQEKIKRDVLGERPRGFQLHASTC
jgi:hypothetical protein